MLTQTMFFIPFPCFNKQQSITTISQYMNDNSQVGFSVYYKQ